MYLILKTDHIGKFEAKRWHSLALEWEEKKRIEQELKKQRDEIKKVKALLDDADQFTKALQA